MKTLALGVVFSLTLSLVFLVFRFGWVWPFGQAWIPLHGGEIKELLRVRGCDEGRVGEKVGGERGECRTIIGGRVGWGK